MSRWRTSRWALPLVFAALLALPASLPAQSPPLSSNGPLSIFDLVGMTFNIDPSLLRAIASVESGGRAEAVSPKGASGLMQLMPDTARRFGVTDVFNPVENLVGAARFLAYLRQYAEIEDLPELLAAYNAGEGAVEHYRGIPPYAETHEYVRRVLLTYLLGDEPLSSQIVRGWPPNRLSASAPSRQPARAYHHSMIRTVQPGSPSNEVRLRAPASVKPVTDADVLARLEQIRRARSNAAKLQRAPEQLP
jgi:Transglycosylase SLT domain